MAEEEQLYYVQDERQYVGNCMLWWCPDGKGYTTQIDEAGLFTAKEVRGMRESEVGWPKEYVEAHIVQHVRRDNMRHKESTIETLRGRYG